MVQSKSGTIVKAYCVNIITHRFCVCFDIIIKSAITDTSETESCRLSFAWKRVLERGRFCVYHEQKRLEYIVIEFLRVLAPNHKNNAFDAFPIRS